MNSLGMNDTFQVKAPGRRYTGLIVVIALHVLLIWGLSSGLARKAMEPLKKVVVEIAEDAPPPPPPPPPPPKPIEKVKDLPPPEAPKDYIPPPEVVPTVTSPTAVAIESAPTPPPPVQAIAPPPPAPVPVGPVRKSIGVACPTQVAPEMPRKAIQDGTTGVVKAQILIKGGVIQDVTILSGPRVFHAAVKAAMMQYKCMTDGGEVLATQEFDFKLD